MHTATPQRPSRAPTSSRWGSFTLTDADVAELASVLAADLGCRPQALTTDLVRELAMETLQLLAVVQEGEQRRQAQASH